MKKYESAVIAPRRQSRPGTIRSVLAGAVLGLLAFALVRPICAWAVYAGTILEGWFQ